MMKLKDFTTEQLEKELERRKIRVEPPEMIENPDLEPIIKILNDYVEYINGEGFCEDNDYPEFIYETVINVFFGEDFWDWFNKKNSLYVCF